MWFADWRGVEAVDYSTNALVANYYSGGHAKYFRPENWDEFVKDLREKGKLRIGIDYYAGFYYEFVARITGGEFLIQNSRFLEEGGVIILEVTSG